MRQAINRPYIKRFDENGELQNPINGKYVNMGSENRKQRRVRPDRMFSNKKGIQMVVYNGDTGSERYVKKFQYITSPLSSSVRKIVHYKLS